MGLPGNGGAAAEETAAGDARATMRKPPPPPPPPAIVASPSWPCANCHTPVSSTRCPTCQGIQVRILDREVRELRTHAFLERLSPALFARRTPTQDEGMASAVAADNNEDDDDEYAFRPLDPVACILASAPSPIHNEKQKLTLQPPMLKEIEDRLRLRKHSLGAAVVAEQLPTPKKTKWLSAV